MKNNKILKFVLSIALVGVIGVGATLAYFTDTDNAINTITMGHVDIDLYEPEWSKNNPNSKIEDVKPGQVIVKDPTVKVIEGSADAYVRMKITVTGNLNEEKAAELFVKNENGTYKYLDIDNSLWTSVEIKEDDVTVYYFYYKDALSAGDVVTLFDNVTIPATWGNDVVGKSFNINVTAEAIQADNFTPTTVDGVYGWYSNGKTITPETYVNN